jgi:hypothetical protein
MTLQPVPATQLHESDQAIKMLVELIFNPHLPQATNTTWLVNTYRILITVLFGHQVVSSNTLDLLFKPMHPNLRWGATPWHAERSTRYQ